jgi:hypothetical protein
MLSFTTVEIVVNADTVPLSYNMIDETSVEYTGGSLELATYYNSEPLTMFVIQTEEIPILPTPQDLMINIYYMDSNNSIVSHIERPLSEGVEFIRFDTFEVSDDVRRVLIGYNDSNNDVFTYSSTTKNVLENIVVSSNELYYNYVLSLVYDNPSYDIGYNQGYQDATDYFENIANDSYDIGFSEGYSNALDESENSFEWIETFFTIFDSFFSIQILPNISFGLLTAVVVVPAVVMKFFGIGTGGSK